MCDPITTYQTIVQERIHHLLMRDACVIFTIRATSYYDRNKSFAWSYDKLMLFISQLYTESNVRKRNCQRIQNVVDMSVHARKSSKC